ncbi:glycosyltransferase family 2 protein [Gillisia sp. Q332]|uniref:glycosyltransferase family 2 protein n=1 Tax=Gillisia xinjiangensis TaxID=3384765 RepID=UPI00391CA067
MPEKPLISIITVNLNDLEGLKRTMTSVFEQTFKEFEYIIIDGGSTDGSKEYIERHSNKIDTWVSEKDSGIYNAMNKGIKAASGEYLLFLNSGDTFYNMKVLSKVNEYVKDDWDILFGNVQLYGHSKKELNKLVIYPEKLTFSFFFSNTIIHQAAFIKRELFDEVFYYNEDLKFVSDWEFFLCAICKFNYSYKKLDFTVTNFNMNGFSSDPVNKKSLNKERELCLKTHFPLMLEDYKELFQLRLQLNIPSVKASLELEDFITARKINRTIVHFLLGISKLKNGKFEL